MAELAGQFIESGKNVLAVVVPRDAEIQGETIAASVADFVRAHGWTAKVAGLDVTQHWPDALSVLRWDVRENVREEFGVDVMIVVVAAGTPACDLLQGQSNLGALVVAIRRRTRITTAISLLRGFRRADPTLGARSLIPCRWGFQGSSRPPPGGRLPIDQCTSDHPVETTCEEET